MTQKSSAGELVDDLPNPRAPISHRIDRRALERNLAGTRLMRRVDGGPPTRLPSGEWMHRIALDLPEAMLDALKERAGEGTPLGQVIRSALVRDGIGGAAHVLGICDGTYADDGEQTEVEAELAGIADQISRLVLSQGDER